MEQTNLVKVVAAFVAGVVVALGSALIYVRVSDMVHPPPAVIPQTASNTPMPSELPDAGSNTIASADLPSQSQASRPEPIPNVAPPIQIHTSAAQSPVRSVRSVAAPPPKLFHDTSEIARNTPARLPTPPAQYPSAMPVDQRSDAGSQPEPQPSADQPLQPEPEASPASSVASRSQPHIVTLPPGVPIAIRLAETLSTDHNYQGDTFRATLDAPIIVNGFIIADRGSKVLGRIVTSERSGRITGAASLTLALTEINTTDSQRVRVDTNLYDRHGSTSTEENTAKIAGGAALGALIGAIAGGGKGAAIGAGAGGAAGTGAVLLAHGKAAVLPVETRLSFRLSSPITLTEKLNY